MAGQLANTAGFGRSQVFRSKCRDGFLGNSRQQLIESVTRFRGHSLEQSRGQLCRLDSGLSAARCRADPCQSHRQVGADELTSFADNLRQPVIWRGNVRCLPLVEILYWMDDLRRQWAIRIQVERMTQPRDQRVKRPTSSSSEPFINPCRCLAHQIRSLRRRWLLF